MFSHRVSFVPPMEVDLNAKTRATATGRGSVGIVYLERCTNELCGKVNFGTGQKFHAHFVNRDLSAIQLNDGVVFVRFFSEIEFV